MEHMAKESEKEKIRNRYKGISQDMLETIPAVEHVDILHTPPPMRFSDLADAELDPSLKPEVDRLLDIKMNVPELKLIPRVDAINSYLDESIEQAELLLDRMGDEQHNDWDELNRLFLEIIGH
ncbi:MAG: nucleotidyltransferase domain-containing protein [Oscillospiraceae bacterium]|nr:nucleotidyltransferase domain-containing protein [Oscillospiraceae bacterium]